jgi:hypothetical protein
MTSTSTMTTVVCGECRHENEPERVYCHDCGARLDRTAVKPRKEKVEDAQKRVKKLFDPHRARIRMLFFKISKVVLAAVVVAAVVQILMSPDMPPAANTAQLASEMRDNVENAASRHQGTRLRYTEDQVNTFLFYALKSKKSSLDQPLLDFKKAVVSFRERSCVVTMERSLFGYSLYTTATYAPKIEGGKLVMTTTGGSIGRLPVHPQIARFMSVLFADLRGALDHDGKLVAKMAAIEVHDKAVVLTAP